MRHGRRDVNFVLPLLGAHNVSNAAAAISVGVTHGTEWPEIQEAIEGMTPDRMRGTVVGFREGFSVIDDCYNSNPRALTGMIKLLAETPGFDRRILVSGDMLELGPDSGRFHAGCGRDAARAGIDLIVGVGPESESMIEGARAAGVGPERLTHVRDAYEAGEALAALVAPGDLVLLKGSRGMRLEQVLDRLRLTFSSLEP
jgi:UDP-N-acetylmuramoyl-tripeptide--D-alanyl-D-alanine ligase